MITLGRSVKGVQLYAGPSSQFIDDTLNNRIAGKLRQRFFQEFRYYPSPGEEASWQNSLRMVSMIFDHAKLRDNGILLEYQLPMTSKRLDVMITGFDPAGQPNGVIIELKQWGETRPSYTEDCVVTFVGGRERDVLHPSRQVGQYQEYLADCHTAFNTGVVGLAACAYLHNLLRRDAGFLLDGRFKQLLTAYPIFTGDQAQELEDFLSQRVANGDGLDVLAKVQNSKYRASKKLLDHTASMIKGNKEYVLLDEQLVVFNSVMSQVHLGFNDRNKAVLLVKGGPGTGKSVLALNLVGRLSQEGHNTQHATGSSAFTGTIRRVVGSRAGVQFRYFNSYATAEKDAIDVLIMDEAHRLRETSNSRYTPATKRSGKSQIDELIQTAKVTVFFIDDLQVVRPGEVGSAKLIREAAERNGADLTEFELDAQFRCNGSETFINWIGNTLGVTRNTSVMWPANDLFEFKIVDSVEELDALIRQRNVPGQTARLTAGFCWPWSDPTPNGQLIPDVTVGGWARPWNAKPDAGALAPNIPKSLFWATDPNGINQVGCIYTAQGFEFDYCGVIFGKDLRYDPVAARWVGDRGYSEDPVVKKSGGQFENLVKQTYRVLLTRGIKGCYVYFEDEATRNFFRSRIEQP